MTHEKEYCYYIISVSLDNITVVQSNQNIGDEHFLFNNPSLNMKLRNSMCTLWNKTTWFCDREVGVIFKKIIVADRKAITCLCRPRLRKSQTPLSCLQ